MLSVSTIFRPPAAAVEDINVYIENFRRTLPGKWGA
jgi:hypothetical protein